MFYMGLVKPRRLAAMQKRHKAGAGNKSAERGRQVGGFYGEAGYLLPVGESHGRK